MHQQWNEPSQTKTPTSSAKAAVGANDVLANDPVFAALSEPGKKRVTDYVSHTERGLFPLEQAETVREMQAHLLSLIAAYQEMGDSETDAITSAIAQFGAAKKVRRDLQRVALRGRIS